MSDTRGERPISRLVQVIGASATVVVLAGTVFGVGFGLHNAQVQADAAHAMTAAAPAYEGAISLDGNLDALNVQSVQAKVAWDAEQARLAAEKAAAEAAAQAAAAAAAQAAAEQAAQQQAQRQATQDASSDDPAPDNSVPFVSDPNSADGGRFDTSQCGSAGATTNPDGSVTCAG